MAISAYLIYKRFSKSKVGAGTNTNPLIYTPQIFQGGSTSNQSTSFPIRQGMNGSQVAAIQHALNGSPCNAKLVEDGDFGPKTASALKICKGVTEVSQALFSQMTGAPATTTSGSGTGTSSNAWKNGDPVYLYGDQSALFSYPSSSYIVGKVEKTFFLDKPIGKYIKDTGTGYAEIAVMGYRPYSNGAYQAMATITSNVYIPVTNIKKTPY